MSLKTMVWVLEHSEERLGRRLVLLALAEYAHDNGTSAYPSVATIARKARLSDRQVKRALSELEAAGAISRTGESPSGTVIWTVSMAGYGGDNTSPPPVTNPPEGVPDLSPDPVKEQPSENPPTSVASPGLDEGTASRETVGDDSAPTPVPAAPSPGAEGAPFLTAMLADLMRRNDPKAKVAPESTGWLDAMRLLVDRDGRNPDEVLEVLHWCQQDEFWRTVILSAPKFREKYPQLRAVREARAKTPNGRAAAAASTSTREQLAAIAARGSRDAVDPDNELRRRAGGR